MFSFRIYLRNESVFETKVKFLFLKRKDLNLQTKVKVFPKRKCFYLENICETSVFETKVKLFWYLKRFFF